LVRFFSFFLLLAPASLLAIPRLPFFLPPPLDARIFLLSVCSLRSSLRLIFLNVGFALYQSFLWVFLCGIGCWVCLFFFFIFPCPGFLVGSFSSLDAGCFLPSPPTLGESWHNPFFSADSNFCRHISFFPHIVYFSTDSFSLSPLPSTFFLVLFFSGTKEASPSVGPWRYNMGLFAPLIRRGLSLLISLSCVLPIEFLVEV